MSGCDLLSAGRAQLHSRSALHTCTMQLACSYHVTELLTACIKGMSSTAGAVLNIVQVFRAVLCAVRINQQKEILFSQSFALLNETFRGFNHP